MSRVQLCRLHKSNKFSLLTLFDTDTSLDPSALTAPLHFPNVLTVVSSPGGGGMCEILNLSRETQTVNIKNRNLCDASPVAHVHNLGKLSPFTCCLLPLFAVSVLQTLNHSSSLEGGNNILGRPLVLSASLRAVTCSVHCWLLLLFLLSCGNHSPPQHQRPTCWAKLTHGEAHSTKVGRTSR